MAHILVVDDERDIVALIKFLLEKDGHTISEAFNGAQALEQLGIEPLAPKPRAELPNLIILDVMMPLVDGYTVSRRVNEDSGTKKIPLLILTAKGQMRDIFEVAPNVVAYVDKPFDPKKLRDIVSGILEKKR